MPLKFQNYYETLGVDRAATADEIKLSFRKLARIHHPDVAKDKVAGEAKFKEINEAYEVLGDPEKRKRYDELGADWQNEGGSAPANGGDRRHHSHSPQDGAGFEFGGTGFSDFFESYFAGRSHPTDESFSRAGQDVEADLLVTLEEVLAGSLRKVSLRRPSIAGEAERTNTYQVRVPPGIREGQRIRLAGQGGAGSGGRPAGDLYLRVRLARHPEFTVDGADLHYGLDLAPWEAALGAKVIVPMLGGSVTLRVPPGSVGGTHLRMPGQGLPREDKTRGDLHATLQIRMPGPATAEERVLWEQLAHTSTFKPRSAL